ncbi:hypothetical protein [Cypionkella sp. TWP1-2-1b2]|uniref:hypothetical protein n=1 Tax=Cypionkella sp. TWP1-2-1b2 TaxID=2804675 RepID=UPI003CF56E2A
MTIDFDRNTIAIRCSDVSNLVGLALDLVAELPFVDSNGHRIRGMDQLDALLRITLAQTEGLPAQIDALK